MCSSIAEAKGTIYLQTTITGKNWQSIVSEDFLKNQDLDISIWYHANT